MKKTYIRPEVFCEFYELSQHVAACGWDLQFKSVESCKASSDPDFDNTQNHGYLFDSGRGCDWISGSGGNVVDYCYTNGADGMNLFRS